jgi:hypothetical protein
LGAVDEVVAVAVDVGAGGAFEGGGTEGAGDVESTAVGDPAEPAMAPS